jgi:hypothetical protein
METLEVKFVGELGVVKPKPGDVFVLSTERSLDSATAERIGQVLRQQLGVERVLVMGDGLKLMVAKPPADVEVRT